MTTRKIQNRGFSKKHRHKNYLSVIDKTLEISNFEKMHTLAAFFRHLRHHLSKLAKPINSVFMSDSLPISAFEIYSSNQ